MSGQIYKNNLLGLNDVDNCPHYDYVLLPFWSGNIEHWFREKKWELKKIERGTETARRSNWRTPAQWFNFLPTSHFLSGLHSSTARGEMWLKLEFPLTGDAEKQDNRGRGKGRARDRRLVALSLHKRKVCKLIAVFLSISGSQRLQTGQSVDPHTHTHTHTSREDRQRQDITLNSYKVRLQHGCVRQGFLKKCGGVTVKYPRPTELPG